MISATANTRSRFAASGDEKFKLSEPGTFRLCSDRSYEHKALKKIVELAEAVPREVSRFDPLGVILTGSFARGEGSLIRCHHQIA